jgi:hypothetical protein
MAPHKITKYIILIDSFTAEQKQNMKMLCFYWSGMWHSSAGWVPKLKFHPCAITAIKLFPAGWHPRSEYIIIIIIIMYLFILSVTDFSLKLLATL